MKLEYIILREILSTTTVLDLIIVYKNPTTKCLIVQVDWELIFLKWRWYIMRLMGNERELNGDK